MTSAFDQFKDFLREMFQYDTNDLDFGIFKILKLKRKYIEQFINGDGAEDLRATVARELARVENVDAEAARNWLTSFAALFGDMGRPVWTALESDSLDEAKQARFRSLFALPLVSDPQRDEAERHLFTWLESQKSNTGNIEERLYNYLLNFFELYYQNGDFGYNSRAANAFNVPYEADYDGSDTFFHWKHKDSYYIKTGASFPCVKCEVAGKKLEFRLETGAESEAETTAQNNNKDKEIKLYRLARIEEQDGVWQVVFHLAKAGTLKTELYPKLWATVFDPETELTPFIFKKESSGEAAKPIFNELAADHDKTDGGQVKGVGQLRLKEESYYKELAKRPEFAGLGKNEADRIEALQTNPTAIALHQLDKALNQFYVGNDADYFIHKDLRGFLTREKDRFIKNVIFSDLDTLLNRNIDNTTLIIGRGFNAVANRIIEFLDTLETFQRNIFTLKKKVIDTHWLISVGKIPEKFYAAIVEKEEQVRQFKDMYGVTIEGAVQLKDHPTLVVDTGLFDAEWALELLSDPAFDNLEDQTDGVIINSENLQALNVLQEKYRGKIDCVYIDPPYNTGSDEFLYKDNFKDSSWIALLFDRIGLALDCLKEKGIFLSSINDIETNNLDMLTKGFDQLQRLGYFIWKTRNTDNRVLTKLSRDHEFVHIFSKGSGNIYGRKIDRSDFSNPDNDTRGDYVTDPLTGKANAEARPNCHYVMTNPETNDEYLPDPDYGWITDWDGYQLLLEDRRISWPKNPMSGNPRKKRFLFETGERMPVSSLGITVPNGSGNIDQKNLFKFKVMDYPKPVALLKQLVDNSMDESSTVLDFFAGSGTTAHAVIVLNKEPPANGKRKFILAEMAKYFDSILKPRIQKVMYSLNWSDGRPIADKVDGYQGIVKVQRLEQYEDVLANLETAWDGETLPKGLPVQYLFRPEHNKLVASLDLCRPFTQTIKAGKSREEKTIDLMESWLYLQGYWVKSRRLYVEDGRKYVAVETTSGVLIVFRDIDSGDDDSATLNAIIGRYTGDSGEPTVTRLEVNYDADIRTVKLPVSLVQAADFDRGASWS